MLKYLEVYRTVRVNDPASPRHNQVGVFIGPGATDAESNVKFDGVTPEVIESIADTALEVV